MAQQTLANISRKDLGFLYSVLDFNPEHGPTVLKLISLITKACDIYMARAANLPEQKIQDLVRDFINETASFNARSLGGHILIWPFFILGTECSQARDREFVIDQLQYLWEWTGFANTLRAIETLKQFWSDDIGNGWIQGLVKQVDVFIMLFDYYLSYARFVKTSWLRNITLREPCREAWSFIVLASMHEPIGKCKNSHGTDDDNRVIYVRWRLASHIMH